MATTQNFLVPHASFVHRFKSIFSLFEESIELENTKRILVNFILTYLLFIQFIESDSDWTDASQSSSRCGYWKNVNHGHSIQSN